MLAVVGEFDSIELLDSETLRMRHSVSLPCPINCDVALVAGAEAMVVSNWDEPYAVSVFEVPDIFRNDDIITTPSASRGSDPRRSGFRSPLSAMPSTPSSSASSSVASSSAKYSSPMGRYSLVPRRSGGLALRRRSRRQRARDSADDDIARTPGNTGIYVDSPVSVPSGQGVQRRGAVRLTSLQGIMKKKERQQQEQQKPPAPPLSPLLRRHHHRLLPTVPLRGHLLGHTDNVFRVCCCGTPWETDAMAPPLVASASNDRSVRVWNLRRMECVEVLAHQRANAGFVSSSTSSAPVVQMKFNNWAQTRVHSHPVFEVLHHAETGLLFEGGAGTPDFLEARIYGWNLSKVQYVRSLSGHIDSVRGMAVDEGTDSRTHRSSLLYTAGMGGLSLTWDLRTPTKRPTFSVGFRDGLTSIRSFCDVHLLLSQSVNGEIFAHDTRSFSSFKMNGKKTKMWSISPYKAYDGMVYTTYSRMERLGRENFGSIVNAGMCGTALWTAAGKVLKCTDPKGSGMCYVRCRSDLDAEGSNYLSDEEWERLRFVLDEVCPIEDRTPFHLPALVRVCSASSSFGETSSILCLRSLCL